MFLYRKGKSYWNASAAIMYSSVHFREKEENGMTNKCCPEKKFVHEYDISS